MKLLSLHLIPIEDSFDPDMDVDVVHEYLEDDDLGAVDCSQELAFLKPVMALVICSWFFSRFSTSLR